jgi:hypothetical protein
MIQKLGEVQLVHSKQSEPILLLFNELCDSALVDLTSCEVNLGLLLFFKDVLFFQFILKLFTPANFLQRKFFYVFLIADIVLR